MTFTHTAAVATRVLTINANARRPGTVDRDDAAEYREAVAHELPTAELLHVMFRLAEFAAARPAEPVTALVRAFAERLALESL